MSTRMTVIRRRDEDPDMQIPADPTAPSSYWFPLLLIILACAGYIVWRRRERGSARAFGYVDDTGAALCVDAD